MFTPKFVAPGITRLFLLQIKRPSVYIINSPDILQIVAHLFQIFKGQPDNVVGGKVLLSIPAFLPKY